MSFGIADHDVVSIMPLASRSPDDAWHLNEFGVKEARSAHNVSGSGVRVAVIDTGVDGDHPYFGRKVVGHDYTGLGPEDHDGHGTHCCGIVHGVAPGAEIHSFRVFDPTNTAVLRNINMALRDILSGEHGRFDVVSMSLGGGEPSHEMRMLLLELAASGVVIFCAAGNESSHDRPDAPRFGTVNWPAQFACTVAVGSVDRGGRRSGFSSSGPKIGVMAPGGNVWSSWKEGQMACLSGTSMACPFVAGVTALLFEACRARRIPPPGLPQILLCIAKSSCDMESPGFDFFTGDGCINPRGMIDRYLEFSDAERSRGV